MKNGVVKKCKEVIDFGVDISNNKQKRKVCSRILDIVTMGSIGICVIAQYSKYAINSIDDEGASDDEN